MAPPTPPRGWPSLLWDAARVAPQLRSRPGSPSASSSFPWPRSFRSLPSAQPSGSFKLEILQLIWPWCVSAIAPLRLDDMPFHNYRQWLRSAAGPLLLDSPLLQGGGHLSSGMQPELLPSSAVDPDLLLRVRLFHGLDLFDLFLRHSHQEGVREPDGAVRRFSGVDDLLDPLLGCLVMRKHPELAMFSKGDVVNPWWWWNTGVGVFFQLFLDLQGADHESFIKKITDGVFVFFLHLLMRVQLVCHPHSKLDSCLISKAPIMKASSRRSRTASSSSSSIFL
ncbi:unnamed protein product [Cyprideis torosa]|uniref:Uncharacterized protein n=1 Tax=Cyprideis torosa TaxID=163714 RepID=A0A7R8ZP61_9CRUS|nr:unnamed protein product [Cyprideis torosa]CAG0898028.1 unnamed protein product [Cyprideis torosa]